MGGNHSDSIIIIKIVSVLVTIHTPFKQTFSNVPGLAGSPLGPLYPLFLNENLWGSLMQFFYGPDALPVSLPTASMH